MKDTTAFGAFRKRGPAVFAAATVRARSAADTYSMAVHLGALVCPGDVIGLEGSLGAGKTLFVQGLAHGMGIRGPVTSPTFTLVNEYAFVPAHHRESRPLGSLVLRHADLYRLADPEEVESIGLFDSSEDAVLAIEWFDRLGHFGGQHLSVRLEARGPAARQLIAQPLGQRYQSRLRDWWARLGRMLTPIR